MNNKKKITIRSSKTTVKFSNMNKLDSIGLFIQEYKRVCKCFIDILWNLDKIPRLIKKDITSSVSSWLSARAIQCCAKQASGIIRGTRQKQKQRMFKYSEFLEKGMFRKAKKLKQYIDKQSMSKPDLTNVQPELDSRFVKIDLDNETSFDGWIVLASLGNKMKVELPFKRTKHFNMMMGRGVLKKGIRLSPSLITFLFDIPVVNKKDEGAIIGLDIGMKNTFSTSDGQQSTNDPHGWNLDTIQEKLSRRKKGSVGFRKTQEHRKNYIHWSINQLNLTDIRKLRLEDIKHLRRGRKSSRQLSHWTYTTIYDKLEDYCFQRGVHVEKISPIYTSQRCSQCGWTRRSNRKGKLLKCGACSFECDSDLNASRNIALALPCIIKKQRLKQPNKKGFYWVVEDQESIVPDVR